MKMKGEKEMVISSLFSVTLDVVLWKWCLTNRSDCSAVEVGWFGHDGGQLGPLKAPQVDLPQVGQDVLSIIATTDEHLWRWEHSRHLRT